MKIRLDTKKIYLAMAEKGLTITEIAGQGGVSQQAVSNCKALGLSAKDIVIVED